MDRDRDIGERERDREREAERVIERVERESEIPPYRLRYSHTETQRPMEMPRYSKITTDMSASMMNIMHQVWDQSRQSLANAINSLRTFLYNYLQRVQTHRLMTRGVGYRLRAAVQDLMNWYSLTRRNASQGFAL